MLLERSKGHSIVKWCSAHKTFVAKLNLPGESSSLTLPLIDTVHETKLKISLLVELCNYYQKESKDA